MALSDLAFPLVLLRVEITELVTDSRHWRISGIIGSICCKFFFFASLVSILVSAQSLVWIAIDRFVAVVFPMKLGPISSKIRRIAIVSTWLCASFVNIPSLIYSKVVERGRAKTCTETNMESFLFDKKANVTYLWLQLSLFIIAPLAVITVLYTAIAITLNKKDKAFSGIPSDAQRHATKKRRQAIKMAIAISVLFYLFVVPHPLVYLSPYWRPSCAIQRVLHFVASFSVYLSSTVNPIICLSFVASYRRGLRNILCLCCRKLNGNVTPNFREVNQTTKKKIPAEKAIDSVSRTQKAITKPLILLYRDDFYYHETLLPEKMQKEATAPEQTLIRNAEYNLGIP